MAQREYADPESNSRAGTLHARVRRLSMLITIIAAGIVSDSASWAARGPQQQTAAAPYVLSNNRTAIGLVYTPELLSALLSQQNGGQYDRQIVDAVRQGRNRTRGRSVTQSWNWQVTRRN